MHSVFLKQRIGTRIKSGHQWIFSNELAEIPKIEAGSIVEVYDSANYFVGLGFFNPKSLIAIRLLNTKEAFNRSVIEQRISDAYALRKKIYGGEEMFRVVFGESDFLPGLIIDKYENCYAVQYLSAGFEKLKEEVINSIIDVFAPKFIIEKNNSQLRQLEGLEQYERIAFGVHPEPLICRENDMLLSINLIGSQKTGYFLDQRDNRVAVAKLSKDLEVLDCYCNQGGFGIACGIAGAKEITLVDISEEALRQAEINLKLNKVKNYKLIREDIPTFLQAEAERKHKYDLIILDPPAFTKSKKNFYSAQSAYRKINRLALRCLKDRGFLATSSCSMHISEANFLEIIRKSAFQEGVSLKMIFRGGQAQDHPILIGMPETQYLKFFIFQKVEKF